VALVDIINRIESDAESEGEVIMQAAEESAQHLVAQARLDAAQLSEQRIERAEREAQAEAATVRANARLAARDAALATRRELIEETLAECVAALVGMPDDAYAQFLGQRIAKSARGGETVHLAAADSDRLASALPAAVKSAAPELELTYSDVPAEGIEHGAILLADRSSEDFSIAGIVAERREELSMTVSRILFATDGEA